MKYGKDNILKIFLFYGIMIFMVVLCIELLSQLAFFIIFGKRYTPENLRSYVVHKYDTTDQKADFCKQDILHPYVGFVFDFGDEKKNLLTQGFCTDKSPLVKREEGKLNVAVLGGSVASGLAEHIEKAWKMAFKVPIRMLNLASPGYKQPQQLMTLSYFLALGSEFDLVINIDGFNDIVLPYVENYVAGINPFFPRSWKLRVTQNPRPQELGLMGKVKYFQDIKRERLQQLDASIFNISATYGIIKLVQFIINNKQIYDSSTQLFTFQRKLPKRFDESGPLVEYGNIPEMHAAAADLWFKCSLLINSLAKDNGFQYYHFLQPDQYLEGSKKLTREEQRIAYNDKHIYKQSVVIGYPMLIARGKTLLKNHVNFFDATMIFADVAETVYCDDCCHFNKRGNQIIADYIIQEIGRRQKLEKIEPAGAFPD